MLLIIDPNNDFADSRGSLYVPHADIALKAIAHYIEENNPEGIAISQDTHRRYHVGHCAYWQGEGVKPFANVRSEDVERGVISPTFATKEQALNYLRAMESKGRVHTLWPEHCLIGSWGWAFPDVLVQAVNAWDNLHHGQRPLHVYQKGEYADAEMFSIFSYVNERTPNEHGKQVLDQLAQYDEVVVCGFAKDYCVAESVKDMRNDPRFEGKLRFFDAGMAAINPQSDNLSIYEDCLNTFGAKTI